MIWGYPYSWKHPNIHWKTKKMKTPKETDQENDQKRIWRCCEEDDETKWKGVLQFPCTTLSAKWTSQKKVKTEGTQFHSSILKQNQIHAPPQTTLVHSKWHASNFATSISRIRSVFSLTFFPGCVFSQYLPRYGGKHSQKPHVVTRSIELHRWSTVHSWIDDFFGKHNEQPFISKK